MAQMQTLAYSTADHAKHSLREMRIGRLVISATVLLLCFGCKNDSSEPKSFHALSNYSLIDHITIWGDSIEAKDYIGTKYKGLVTDDGIAHFEINNSVVSYPVRRPAADSFYLDSRGFVEVPIETFNPVKTVTDLLSPMHQA